MEYPLASALYWIGIAAFWIIIIIWSPGGRK